jgi:glycosyltransferase involved in cell wall biosynthesis
MRIAMAAPLYLPDLGGGAIQVCRSLSAHFREAGHSVSLLVGRATAKAPVGDIEREIWEGSPLWRINLGNGLEAFSAEGYRNVAAEPAFADFFAEIRPDVLHVHGLQGLGIGLLQAASMAGVPIVVTLHDWWWFCPCLFGLSRSDQVCPMPLRPEGCSGCESYDFDARREALAAVLPLVDRFLVPSNFLYRSLVEQGFPEERLEVSPNGTAPPSAETPEKESLPGILRIGFFGGAGNREKGLADLGAAIRELPVGRFQFLLYGVPRVDLEMDRSDVVHPPAFDPADLDIVFAGIDILVVPSRMRESFSLVTREAMVRGVPVVATECGGPEEVVVDGSNGFRIPVGDSSALAAVLQRLADDRPLEASLAKEARRTAAAFPSIEQQSLRTIDVYDAVLQESSRRRHPPSRPELEGLRVLFLSGCDGAPLRYRVHHAAESLALIGVASRVLHYAAPEADEAIRHADLVILFRTPFGPAVHRLLRKARHYRLPVVFSSDDLIFHPDWTLDAPALFHEDASLVRGFRESAEACARTASYCDAIIGSSSELVAAAEDLGLPGFLLRNSTGGLLEEISRSCAVGAEGAPRMGYFSGTDTHDRDLASIAPALAGAMAAIPTLGLTLGGPLNLPSVLTPFAHRIEELPLLGWSDLPAELSRMQVNLAPLEASGHFNAAKSDVKFLEAALVGVPTVASPRPEFLWGTRGGRLARLADTLPAWEEAVVDLVRKEQRRRCLGDSARAAVLESRRPGDVAEDWGDALREIWTALPPSRNVLPGDIPGHPSGYAQVALEPASLVTDIANLMAVSGEPLCDERPLVQEIVCRHARPRRIDLRFGTYGRENPHQVHIAVFNAAGQALGRRSVSAESLVDRAFVEVPLMASESARQLRIEIRSEGAGPGNEVLVWRGPRADTSLRIGDRPAPGESISFRVFSEMPS